MPIKSRKDKSRAEWLIAAIFIIAAALVFCLLASRGADADSLADQQRPLVAVAETEVIIDGSCGVTRFLDTGAEVVCWYYFCWHRGGLSCLPYSEVDKGIWDGEGGLR